MIQLRAARAFLAPVLFVLGLLAISLVWRYTPLARLVELDELVARAEALRQNPAVALLAPLIFIVLALLLVPVTLLRAATVITFGPLLGPVYALVGGVVAALIGHALGQRAGAAMLERLAGERVARVRERFQGPSGPLKIAAMRLVPLGPFTLVNAVCGAASIKRGDFILGTTLVMIPGLVMLALAMTIFPALQSTIFPDR